MKTIQKLGPADRGRVLTLDEFMAGDYEEGYEYELIDGELYVTPLPNLPQNWVENWLYNKVSAYARKHPEVINFVTNKARVFVPGRVRVTNPEPDLSAYHDFPISGHIRDLRWQDFSPILVGEVASIDDPDKDWVRNVELYLQVPSIKEYWLVDTREDPERPHLTVHRRHGGKWRVIEVGFGETYSPRFLPGFKLVNDPRR